MTVDKREVKKIVRSALHAHNKEMMRQICKNGRKELYNHVTFLRFREMLRSETGLFVTEEDGIVFEIGRF